MRSLFLFLLLVSVVSLTAQSRISGSEIIAMLDDGKDVRLENATVTGDLDFTKLADREEEKKDGWGNRTNYRCHVRNTLSFVNCTFEGKVLGYLSEGDGWNGKNNEPLYNVDFHDAVTFRDCKFTEDAHFKYSKFYDEATFADSRFDEDALFKYTEFETPVNFSNTNYRGSANFKYTDFEEEVTFANADFSANADFKYTKFPEGVDFSKVVFGDDADFKYTNFKRGVNFSGTTFEDSADFKYAKFSGDSDFTGTDFGRHADFKYTTVNGRKWEM